MLTTKRSPKPTAVSSKAETFLHQQPGHGWRENQLPSGPFRTAGTGKGPGASLGFRALSSWVV